MNKKFIILFAFVILVEAISSMSSVESKSFSNVKCDSGVETFDLVLLLPSGPSKLDVTLEKDQDKLTATCVLKPLNPDIPNDSDMIASDSEIPSTEIEKNNEENSDSDMASSDSDEVGTLDGNDASVTYECTLAGSPKEGSYKIIEVKGDGVELKNLESLTVELLPCDSDSSNEISSENLSNTINESNEDLLSTESDLSDTTLSVEIDRGKSDIRLSFRQVSGFNLNAFTFNFFGLTTKDIPADFSFIFMIYYITGAGKGKEPVEATCKIDKLVTLSGSPMAPANFTCTFPKTDDLVSIEIASCDGVAGLPFDDTLLNPKLTDDGIKSGALKDKSNMPIPSFATVDMNSFNFDFSKGTFTFKLTVDSLPTEIKPDQTFVLFFNGIKFGFTIISIEGKVLSFDVKIFGEINDQPIAFEQTVVTINGIEAFVIPGFLTEERITTKGLPNEPENSDNKEGSSDNEDTDEKSSEETAQSSDEGKTDEDSTEQAETNRSSSTDLDEQISDDPKFEEAEKRLEIFITFRQINGFTFVSGTISFNFFALITQTLKIPYNITLLFNLITTEGMEEDPTEIQCQLVETVEVNDGETKQATFKCEKTVSNTSITYTGLRLISSEDIAGIPYDDETLLNPALTDEAIKNGDLKDANVSVVPPSFEFTKLDTQKCSEDGKFLLTGKLDKETTIANKFTIPLTYPPNVVITCTFGKDGIQCIADEQLVGSVMIEQQIIKEGADELFILKKVKQEDINCENGLKVQAEEKLKVDISFRQVSHIEQKAGGNGLRFFFAGFVNKDLAKAYTVNMKVIVIIKKQKVEQKVEKEAKCTLEEEVKVTKGKETQADFNCDLDLAADEEVKPENLTVSTNNENIGGCEELTNEELSPSLTQEAIDEKSELPLSQVLDYQVEENKEKVPPTFTINSMDFKKCKNKGKIKIEGQFSEEITEEMTFELPLTFPKTKVKCTVKEAQANTNVNITCKMQKVKGGLKFTELLVEPRLLKKKRMEMFYVQQKKHTLNEEETCQDYNEIKKAHAKNRTNADFTFLQLGRPSGFSGLFFLALTKKMFTGTFTTLTIQVTITIEQSRRRRRNLNTLELDEPTSVECKPETSTDKSVALNCKSDKNLVPVSSELEGDDIGGAPDEITVDKNPNPDYSKLDNLENFDNLASVNITDLNSSNCAKTGEYTIKGVYEGELADNENIMIPFDTPDSSGLCSMKVDSSNKNLTLTCQNTDYFDVSEVMLSNKMVYVNESTPLFKITNDFTAPNQFSCAISDKSLIVPTQAPITTPAPSSSSDSPGVDSSRTRYKKDSNGLGGGAIAGIVIACVVVVGIVAALIILTKNGTFASKSAVTATSIDNNSTVNGFKMDEQNPNMV